MAMVAMPLSARAPSRGAATPSPPPLAMAPPMSARGPSRASTRSPTPPPPLLPFGGGDGTMTPRGPPQALQSARGSIASGGGESTLKAAGIGLLGPKVPRLKLARHDVAPGVPPAGKATVPQGVSVILPPPQTPEFADGVRQRHRHRTQPGEGTVHWGLKGASIPDPGRGYGRPCPKDDDVAQVFRAGQLTGVAEYRNGVGESVYDSSKKEPLGRSWVRGHRLPDVTQAPDFPGFGLKCPVDDPAKLSIFPRGTQADPEEVRAMYGKTHGSSEAGEQFSREYAWPRAVASNRHHLFGRSEAKDSNKEGLGVKTALTMDMTPGEAHAVPNTQVVDIMLARFIQVNGDKLGTARNLLQTERQLPEDHVHGKSTASDGLSAGKLIRGAYSHAEQLPDDDLGRCTVEGRRNLLTEEPFGMPSIRYGCVPPKLRALADTTNYGDEHDARGLIAPGKFQHRGLQNEDFWTKRSPEELYDYLYSIRGVSREEFEEIFARAADLHPDADPQSASLEALMLAYADWAAGNGPGAARAAAAPIAGTGTTLPTPR